MKKLEILKKIGIIVGIILTIFLIFNFIPPKKVMAENSFRATEKEHTIICAEKGGSITYPENTRKAFDYAIRSTSIAGIIELDIRTTSDNELVIINDESINRVALNEDAEIVNVHDKPLSELRKYNLGLNFVNEKDQKPYESYSISSANSLGLTIMTFNEFLDRYAEQRAYRLYVDIKENGDLGKAAVDKIIGILEDTEYDWYDGKVMIISEHQEIIDYTSKKYPNQLLGACGETINKFVNIQKFGLGLFYTPKYQMIQVEMNKKTGLFAFNLAKKSFINGVHGKNIAITFFGVTSEEDMKKLIDMGADVISTNNPKLLNDILKEKEYR